MWAFVMISINAVCAWLWQESFCQDFSPMFHLALHNYTYYTLSLHATFGDPDLFQGHSVDNSLKAVSHEVHTRAVTDVFPDSTKTSQLAFLPNSVLVISNFYLFIFFYADFLFLFHGHWVVREPVLVYFLRKYFL